MVGLVVAIVTLAAVLRAGSTYFHCAMMNVDQESACCSQEEPAPLDEIREKDCCERRVVDRLPDASGTAAIGQLSAPFVALIPPVAVEKNPWSRLAVGLRVSRARAAPRDPPTRASLMVFLT